MILIAFASYLLSDFTQVFRYGSVRGDEVSDPNDFVRVYLLVHCCYRGYVWMAFVFEGFRLYQVSTGVDLLLVNR